MQRTIFFFIAFRSAAQQTPPIHTPKASAKSTTVQTIDSIDAENKDDTRSSDTIESAIPEKIFSNFTFMKPTSFDVQILKKKTFYKLPASPLIGNALFSHIAKFLYNTNKENGTVICSRAFKVRSSKNYIRQVHTNMANSNL